MRTLSCLPCDTTVACTVAPDTRGVPTLIVAAVADCQHLVDHDFLAYVRSNLFYFNFFAGSNAILLAAGFYDRVHVDLLKSRGLARTDFRRAQDYSMLAVYSQARRRSRASAGSAARNSRSGRCSRLSIFAAPPP